MIRDVTCNAVKLRVLTWDGDFAELRAFNENGDTRLSQLADGVAIEIFPDGRTRVLAPGDIFIKPADVPGTSILHLFHDSWWVQGLLGIDHP